MSVAGLAVFSIATQPLWWKNVFCAKRKTAIFGIISQSNISINGGKQVPLLSADDIQHLAAFRRFQNSPLPLFKLALPCLLSVIFCPATLYSAPLLVNFLYPKEHGGMPVINDVIQAFLMPAGLVYAIAFGFALQNALQSQDFSSQNLRELSTLLRQSTALVDKLNVDKTSKAAMIRALKTTVIRWMSDVIKRRVDTFYEGQ